MALYEPNWSSPNLPLKPRYGEVDIWRASLNLPDFAVKNLSKHLTPDEVLKADIYEFEEDRDRYSASRGILRSILGLYLDRKPSEVHFKYNEHGKPFLPDNNLQFNLSHSSDIALFAFTPKHPVGVDLEYVNNVSDIETLARHYLTDREKSIYNKIPDTMKRSAFITCWTLKEAYIKSTGKSLKDEIKTLDVCFKEDGSNSALSFIPAPGYVASIMVASEKIVYHFYNY